MYAITGATGNTGRRVAAALLAEKQPVRLLVRSPEKVQDLAKLGAEVAQGSLSDVAFLKRAFEGCSGLYLLTPLDWSSADPAAAEVAIGKAFAEALAGSAAHAVYLSVLKSRDQTGIPHFETKAQIEAALEAACTNLTVLRPGFFMQNFQMQGGALASSRTISYPLPPDQPIAMVSCDDIAEIVKQALLRGPKGKEAYDVIGPRCYTMGECARLFSNAIGKTVYFRRMSEEDWGGMMKSMGGSSRIADDFLKMFRFFSEQRFTGDFDNVRKAFKYSSIPFEKFADEMTAALKLRGRH